MFLSMFKDEKEVLSNFKDKKYGLNFLYGFNILWIFVCIFREYRDFVMVSGIEVLEFLIKL